MSRLVGMNLAASGTGERAQDDLWRVLTCEPQAGGNCKGPPGIVAILVLLRSLRSFFGMDRRLQTLFCWKLYRGLL